MNKFLNCAVLSLSTSLAFSGSLTYKGDVDVQVASKKPSFTGQKLTFRLPTYELSKEAKSYLRGQLSHYPANAVKTASFSSELPGVVNLGMLSTPVLNQGYHGSCVTFAVTAALDAALGAGDYISQLCNLELGSYLAIHDKIEASGWNGSLGSIVLQQASDYGVISQNHQKTYGCAGVKDYNLKDETDQGSPMSEHAFLDHSILLSNVISWDSLLSDKQAFSANMNDDSLVSRIREELAKGNRLTIGLVLDVDLDFAGAMGNYHTNNDTWMLTPAIMMDAVNGSLYAAHELVITGYNDFAEVGDGAGHLNRGVYTLRNSWSEAAGDKGDYYVTYDYVKFLAVEAMAIRVNHKSV